MIELKRSEIPQLSGRSNESQLILQFLTAWKFLVCVDQMEIDAINGAA